jgi:acyl-CoA thioesterase FadM
MSVFRSRWFLTLLWGNTVALSWMWGLGLFFSVQFTILFGLFGLLTFAIPNALGLLAFGLITHHIARRESGSESLARFFGSWARPFRLVFFLYQFLAIALTLFVFLKYGWQSMGFEPWLLYLPLTLLIGLAAAVLFGEEFDIRRIKYSHGVMALLLLAAVAVVGGGALNMGTGPFRFPRLPTDDANYWGYAIPIIIGFLVGPWLDLQQWQRAIQMHRERVSVAGAYWVGALEFFGLLLFHGSLALWALNQGAGRMMREGLAGHQYGHETILRLFYENAAAMPWVFVAYCVFLCVCVLTTLDSGYISLKWYLQEGAAKSNNPIFTLIPQKLLASPIPAFLAAGCVAFVATVTGLELEYFMIFYATFFVGYSALGISRCYLRSPANTIPQIKMFCIGSLAVVIFAYGYFLRYPLFMVLGSLLPLGSIAWLLLKPGAGEDFISGSEELEAQSHDAATSAGAAVAAPAAASAAAGPGVETGGAGTHDVGGYFEGKWFVHSFVATYADTNSVGNVYFGMYAMWVGKTRELFFNRVMPKFNLKNTPFYILTRSFEHKFTRETREFETVSVRIRIANYNRKFVTLEHQIYDSSGNLLGHGKQTLLFVSSTDYKMIDAPSEVISSFIAYA